MRTMHLFAGIGGGLLADVILGHSPILAVETNPYCCQVLRERVEDGWFAGMHVHEGDIREFDFSIWNGRVDQISAGFPCQDISAAGRGIGIAGERSGLVSEVWRAIDAIRPKFVFLENSPRINTRGRDVSSGKSLKAEDTRSRMGQLQPLMSVHSISGIGGGCWLPTLTACSYGSNQGGGAGRKGKVRLSLQRMLPTLTASDGTGGPGISLKRTGGQNLRTKLPTLCATDYKSPYSADGYQKQTEKRSKPLRDTAANSVGIKLTPTFAEWYQGFPLKWSQSKDWATRKSRSKRL